MNFTLQKIEKDIIQSGFEKCHEGFILRDKDSVFLLTKTYEELNEKHAYEYIIHFSEESGLRGIAYVIDYETFTRTLNRILKKFHRKSSYVKKEKDERPTLRVVNG